jgi:hypothetical protein
MQFVAALVGIGEARGVAQEIAPSRPTRMSATSGRYLLTGSVSASLPSSTSIIAATLVTGLVIEAIQKIASGFSGIFPAQS